MTPSRNLTLVSKTKKLFRLTLGSKHHQQLHIDSKREFRSAYDLLSHLNIVDYIRNHRTINIWHHCNGHILSTSRYPKHNFTHGCDRTLILL